VFDVPCIKLLASFIALFINLTFDPDPRQKLQRGQPCTKTSGQSRKIVEKTLIIVSTQLLYIEQD
jgi:hypothetical protein